MLPFKEKAGPGAERYIAQWLNSCLICIRPPQNREGQKEGGQAK